MVRAAQEGVLVELRAEVRALLGPGRGAHDLELLRCRDESVVAGVGPYVLKLVGPSGDVERTTAVVGLARAAGVAVPAVVATGPSVGRANWRCVLSERAPGRPWREVQPGLSASEMAGVHDDLAGALLAVQSVRFPAMGELQPEPDRLRVVGGTGVVAALRQRAALRVRDASRRAVLEQVLAREAGLLEQAATAVLCHDDLHSANVLVARAGSTWRLSAVLDWDKAWAGPAESDVARTGFWDGMTGPAFWARYRAGVPVTEGEQRRALVHRLLWCFEYEDPSPRHAADTAELCRALGVRTDA